MKIYPISNYNYNLKAPRTGKNQGAAANTYASNPLHLNAIYSPAFFGAGYQTLGQQLLSLDGIHCPCCGDETVSVQTSAKIVKAAGDAATLPEYADILLKNEEYFHPKYQTFVRSLHKLSRKYPEKSVPEAIRMLRAGSSKFILNKMHEQGKYLDELYNTGNFSNSDREKIKIFADYLNSAEKIPKKNEYEEMYRKTLRELESEDRKAISNKVNTGIISAFNYRSALLYSADKSKGLKEQAYIIKTMLSYSQSTLAKIYGSRPDSLRYNNMLICKECEPRYKTFNFIKNSPEAQKRLEAYVEDISKAINDNKLTGNNAYVYEFIGAANSFGDSKKILKRTNIDGIVQSKIFSERKRGYMFEQYEGIPCAICGTTTITHNQKMKLYKDVLACENLHELANIVKLNYHHITPKNKIICDRFFKILENNPDIDEHTMLKELQILSKQDIKERVEKISGKIEKFAKNNSFNFIEREIINDFLFRLKDGYMNLPYDKEFRNDDYNAMIAETLGTLHNKKKTALINLAKDDIKDIYMKDYIVNPPACLIKSSGGEMKAMIQNIFKMSVITVDHMDAVVSGGSDEYYNKIGCCKDCNSEKGRTYFYHWAEKHPEINENFPKHLKYISNIIKQEKIKEMYDYPEQAAKQANRLARGKVHIPTNYGLKD